MSTEKDLLVFDNQLQTELRNWNVLDHLKGLDVPDILKHQPKNRFAVAAINVEKGLNVGSMIRSAVCFGADEFVIIGKSRYDKRSTVGAQNYIQVTKKSFEDSLYYMSQQSYFPVAIETDGKPWNERKEPGELDEFLRINKYLRPCFVFGGEAEGIPEWFLDQCKFKYRINQPGVLRSLNVSVAFGIILNSYINGY